MIIYVVTPRAWTDNHKTLVPQGSKYDQGSLDLKGKIPPPALQKDGVEVFGGQIVVFDHTVRQINFARPATEYLVITDERISPGKITNEMKLECKKHFRRIQTEIEDKNKEEKPWQKEESIEWPGLNQKQQEIERLIEKTVSQDARRNVRPAEGKRRNPSIWSLIAGGSTVAIITVVAILFLTAYQSAKTIDNEKTNTTNNFNIPKAPQNYMANCLKEAKNAIGNTNATDEELAEKLGELFYPRVFKATDEATNKIKMTLNAILQLSDNSKSQTDLDWVDLQSNKILFTRLRTFYTTSGEIDFDKENKLANYQNIVNAKNIKMFRELRQKIDFIVNDAKNNKIKQKELMEEIHKYGKSHVNRKIVDNQINIKVYVQEDNEILKEVYNFSESLCFALGYSTNDDFKKNIRLIGEKKTTVADGSDALKSFIETCEKINQTWSSNNNPEKR